MSSVFLKNYKKAYRELMINGDKDEVSQVHVFTASDMALGFCGGMLASFPIAAILAFWFIR